MAHELFVHMAAICGASSSLVSFKISSSLSSKAVGQPGLRLLNVCMCYTRVLDLGKWAICASL